MRASAGERGKSMVGRAPLAAFFALTFAITWGVGLLAAVAPPGIVGQLAFYVAVYGPTLSALLLTGLLGGGGGLKKLLGGAVRWRVGARWYLVVLVGLPLSWVVASLLGAAFGEGTAGFASMEGLLLLPVLLFTDPGPIGEEIGWRGFALPGLLERAGALTASVALGVVWAVWHLPAFVLPGFPQSDGPFLLFTAALVAQSVLMTWIYRGTGGSSWPASCFTSRSTPP